MLTNKSIWICLLFLFIVSGCGVSRKEYQRVQDLLTDEQKGHAETKKKLETTQKELSKANTELSRIKRLLNSEKAAHAETKMQLREAEAKLETTQKELSKANTELSRIKRLLNSEKAAHAETKMQLREAEAKLETTQKELSKANMELNSVKQQLDEIKGKYRNLFNVKSLTIENYFTLGEVLVKQGIDEKKNGNFSKAEDLFKEAIGHLRKLTDNKHKLSADAHYYIARAYYEMNEHGKALAEAKTAIQLAPGRKHERAQQIVDRIPK